MTALYVGPRQFTLSTFTKDRAQVIVKEKGKTATLHMIVNKRYEGGVEFIGKRLIIETLASGMKVMRHERVFFTNADIAECQRRMNAIADRLKKRAA